MHIHILSEFLVRQDRYLCVSVSVSGLVEVGFAFQRVCRLVVSVE